MPDYPILELTITALSHAGEGIGRHEGRAIFVPYALPGETVRAEIVEEKRNFARAQLAEVLAASPDRITPRCPHHFALHSTDRDAAAGFCGGCQLQHLRYEAQLRFKQQMVGEQLQRVGGFAAPPVRPTLPSPQPFNYRNHVQFSVTPEGRLGFRAAASHRLAPIRECHLLPPALAEVLARIQIEARPGLDRLSLRLGAEDEVLLMFETEAEPPDLELDLPVSAAWLRPDGSALALAGSAELMMEVHGRLFRVSAGSFFQVNTPLAREMVDLVLQGLALTGGEAVLDLYSGVGLFTAFIAPHAARVVGVEAFEPAVNDAAANLDEFDNVEIYAAPAERVLPGLGLRFDAVVLDPPRAGCAPEVVQALLAMGAARLVYVSCDPATLARDVKRLSAGGYRLVSAQPLDMFPQTHPIDTLAVF